MLLQARRRKEAQEAARKKAEEEAAKAQDKNSQEAAVESSVNRIFETLSKFEIENSGKEKVTLQEQVDNFEKQNEELTPGTTNKTEAEQGERPSTVIHSDDAILKTSNENSDLKEAISEKAVSQIKLEPKEEVDANGDVITLILQGSAQDVRGMMNDHIEEDVHVEERTTQQPMDDIQSSDHLTQDQQLNGLGNVVEEHSKKSVPATGDVANNQSVETAQTTSSDVSRERPLEDVKLTGDVETDPPKGDVKATGDKTRSQSEMNDIDDEQKVTEVVTEHQHIEDMQESSGVTNNQPKEDVHVNSDVPEVPTLDETSSVVFIDHNALSKLETDSTDITEVIIENPVQQSGNHKVKDHQSSMPDPETSTLNRETTSDLYEEDQVNTVPEEVVMTTSESAAEATATEAITFIEEVSIDESQLTEDLTTEEDEDPSIKMQQPTNSSVQPVNIITAHTQIVTSNTSNTYALHGAPEEIASVPKEESYSALSTDEPIIAATEMSKEEHSDRLKSDYVTTHMPDVSPELDSVETSDIDLVPETIALENEEYQVTTEIHTNNNMAANQASSKAPDSRTDEVHSQSTTTQAPPSTPTRFSIFKNLNRLSDSRLREMIAQQTRLANLQPVKQEDEAAENDQRTGAYSDTSSFDDVRDGNTSGTSNEEINDARSNIEIVTKEKVVKEIVADYVETVSTGPVKLKEEKQNREGTPLSLEGSFTAVSDDLETSQQVVASIHDTVTTGPIQLKDETAASPDSTIQESSELPFNDSVQVERETLIGDESDVNFNKSDAHETIINAMKEHIPSGATVLTEGFYFPEGFSTASEIINQSTQPNKETNIKNGKEKLATNSSSIPNENLTDIGVTEAHMDNKTIDYEYEYVYYDSDGNMHTIDGVAYDELKEIVSDSMSVESVTTKVPDAASEMLPGVNASETNKVSNDALAFDSMTEELPDGATIIVDGFYFPENFATGVKVNGTNASEASKDNEALNHRLELENKPANNNTTDVEKDSNDSIQPNAPVKAIDEQEKTVETNKSTADSNFDAEELMIMNTTQTPMTSTPSSLTLNDNNIKVVTEEIQSVEQILALIASHDPSNYHILKGRTDRQSLLNHLENTSIQEIFVEGENPDSPPVKIMVSSNSDREQPETFDINVHSSFNTGGGQSSKISGVGQVIPVKLDHNVMKPSVSNTAPSTSKLETPVEDLELESRIIDDIEIDALNEPLPTEEKQSTTSVTKKASSATESPEEAPSFLGTLFNILTRTPRPRVRQRPRPQQASSNGTTIMPDARTAPAESRTNDDTELELKNKPPVSRPTRPRLPFLPRRPSGFKPPGARVRPTIPTFNPSTNAPVTEETDSEDSVTEAPLELNVANEVNAIENKPITNNMSEVISEMSMLAKPDVEASMTTDEPETVVEEKENLVSTTTVPTRSTIPQVIKIDVPLEDFISQLRDGPTHLAHPSNGQEMSEAIKTSHANKEDNMSNILESISDDSFLNNIFNGHSVKKGSSVRPPSTNTFDRVPPRFNEAPLDAEHRLVPSFGLTAPLPITPPLQRPHRPTIVLPGSRPTRPLNSLSGFNVPPPPPQILPSDNEFSGTIGAPRIPAINVPDTESDLPSTLPNLQIIPFVASDAINKDEDDGLVLDQDFVHEILQAPLPGQHELCWKDGELVSDAVPVCQSCRCYFGQLICRPKECQEVPQHCRAVAQQGECCPMIVCDHEIKEGERIPMADEDALYEEYMSGDVDYYHEEYYDDMMNETDPTLDFTSSTTTVVPTTLSTTPVPTTTVATSTTPLQTTKARTPLPIEERRPLIPNRFFDLLNQLPTTKTTTVGVDAEIASSKEKTVSGPSRDTVPFIARPRPGGRPSLLPPRKTMFRVPPPPRTVTTTDAASTDPPRTTPKVKRLPTLMPFTPTTIAPSTPLGIASFINKIKSKKDSDKPRINLIDEFESALSLEPAELENLVSDDEITNKKTTPAPKLPEIPDEVLSLLPLGLDPILASGFLKLSACNVYGRVYDVGERIEALSAHCKACQCTPVGVQCLPTC